MQRRCVEVTARAALSKESCVSHLAEIVGANRRLQRRRLNEGRRRGRRKIETSDRLPVDRLPPGGDIDRFVAVADVNSGFAVVRRAEDDLPPGEQLGLERG